jgi:hypothetical protein
MTEEVEAFWDAAAMLADEKGYHDLEADELTQAGEQSFLEYAAALAALDPSKRQQPLRATLERLGPEFAA